MTAAKRFNIYLFSVTVLFISLAFLCIPPITEYYFIPDERIVSGFLNTILILLVVLFSGASVLGFALLAMQFHSDKWLKYFSKLLKPASYLVLSILVIEIFFRIFFPTGRYKYLQHLQPHDQLGWNGKANAHYSFRSKETKYDFSLNENGFRGKKADKEENRNAFRFYGDSFTFGYEVADSLLFSSVYEKKYLRNTLCYNYAVTGYGLHQELMTYKASEFQHPGDTVCLFLYAGNDFLELDSSSEAFYLFNRPVLERVGFGFTTSLQAFGSHEKLRAWAAKYLPESHLLNYLKYFVFSHNKIPKGPEDYLNLILPKEKNNAVKLMEVLIREFRTLTRQNNQEFVVFMIPSYHQLKDAATDPSFTIQSRDDLVFLEEYFLTLADKYNFKYFNLAHAYILEMQRGRKIYFEQNLHLRPEGHKVTARAMNQFFQNEIHESDPVHRMNKDSFMGSNENLEQKRQEYGM